MHDYSSLIGLEYEKCNCWEAVRRFYALVFGVNLKRYFDGPVPSREDRKALIFSNVGDFERVETPKFGDIATVCFNGIETHIVVILEDDRIFHSLEGVGTCIERFSRWKSRVSGFYRLKGQDQ